MSLPGKNVLAKDPEDLIRRLEETGATPGRAPALLPCTAVKSVEKCALCRPGVETNSAGQLGEAARGLARKGLAETAESATGLIS